MHSCSETVEGLQSIARLLLLSGKDAFKARAYERGASAVSALGDDLGAAISEERLEKIEGIGPSLKKQIVALWTTGASPLLDKLTAEYPPGAAELSRVPSLTLRRMQALHTQLGITSMAALREACSTHAVQHVPGIGAKTEARIAAEIEALLRTVEHAGPKYILLHEALALAESIGTALCGAGHARAVHVTGDARRADEVIATLELLVVCDEPARVLEALAEVPGVTVVHRDTHTGHLSAGIGLALHFATEASFALQLVTTTGPRHHVQGLVERAHARGVVVGSSTGPFADEASLYAAAGASWVPPEVRDGDDTFSADFSDLLRVGDLRGMVHCHTTYSDGKDSVEAMARAALACGMEYITITDHSPAAHYANGVDIERMKRLWDEIAEVQERVPIRILRGTESDILADGSLDYPDAILEQLDVVIASIHTRHRMDKAAMTSRLERALSLPVFKIWGHALGRLLLSREPLECDLERVLDALAESRGAVEISCDPHRLDLPPAFIPLARQRGLPFVISVDAHSTAGMRTLPLGVKMARRGGVRKREVLNALSAVEFARRVQPIRG